MAGLAVYSARVRKGYANRAQRITLAAAVFDEHGRVLVTPDGFMPSEVVTSTFLQKVPPPMTVGDLTSICTKSPIDAK